MPNDNSAMIKAAAVAANTQRINIAIGILSPYLRHLSSIAADAMGIDELSKGRFQLGLGVPVWKMAAYGFTVKGLKPLQTMKEAYIILKDLMHNRPTSIESEFFGIPKGMQMTVSPIPKDLPIFFGVINKRLLQLAGEVADSIQLGAATQPHYVRWAVDQIRIGAERVDRDPDSIPVHTNVMTAIHDDSEKARELIKPQFAWYLSFLEKVMFTGTGITEADLAPIKKANQEGGAEAAIPYVTDKMIDAMTFAGTPDEIISGMKRFKGTGVSHLLIFGALGEDDAQAVHRYGKEVLPALRAEL
jgi:alkanesulfonate monooxygenase SsuD/methylene tetrahydromethanopterin reductase-like flavin-dependent oxidoreductase (luciferase family)